MYSVILPTYNEIENVETIVRMIHDEFKQLSTNYQIVVVDDNSQDGTFDKAVSLGETYNVRPVKRKEKLGLASAYSVGLKNCAYSMIFVMDADLSHDPRYLRSFIEAQESTNCDIVTGSRYAAGGGVYGWNVLRKLTSLCANNVAQAFLGIETTDVTGSYRLYKRDVLDSLLSQVTSIGYSVQMELMYLAEKGGLEISEVPIVFTDRMRGSSKFNFAEIVHFATTIVVLLAKP